MMRNVHALAAAVLMLATEIVFAEDGLPVLKSAAYPGDIVRDEMIAFKPGGGAGLGSTFVRSREALLGKMVRRTLLPGQPIPAAAVREPYAVQQGKQVPLIAEGEGLTISGFAIALEAGSPGETVTARNIDGGATVRGIVHLDGSLRIALP